MSLPLFLIESRSDETVLVLFKGRGLLVQDAKTAVNIAYKTNNFLIKDNVLVKPKHFLKLGAKI
jgi:hypothetical protein